MKDIWQAEITEQSKPALFYPLGTPNFFDSAWLSDFNYEFWVLGEGLLITHFLDRLILPAAL